MNKKLLSLLLFVMAAFTAAFAQETMTVYDGTNTNNYVPVYGLWADSYNKCEIVMDANELGDLPAGSTITGLTWYFSSAPAAAWGGNFQVFIKEISATSLSDFTGMTGATVVWEGPLDGTSGQIALNFDSYYTYEGGNLLIGVYQTQTGTYKGASFYGVGVEGASVGGYSSSSLDAISANQRNFVPKTTFTYTPGDGPVYNKPQNLQVSNITTNGAVATWEAGGEETAWNLEYKKAADEEWTEVHGLTVKSYTFDALANGTIYEVRVQADYGEGQSGWLTTSFQTLMCNEEDMGEVTYVLTDSYGDGWNGNKIQIVVHETGALVEELTIPSGGNLVEGTVKLCYGVDYDLVWVAGSYGYETGFTVTAPDGTVIYDYQGNGSSSNPSPTAGVLTTFQISQVTCPRPTALAASNVVYNGATLTWTPGDAEQDAWQVIYAEGTPAANAINMVPVDVTGEATYNITGLAENKTYTAYVRGNCSENDKSNWSDAVTFTTPLQFPLPTDLAIDDITAKSAVATWEGNAESYNLRYRKPGGVDQVFFDSFEGSVNWTLNDADGDGNNWGVIKISNYSMGGVQLAAQDGDYCLISQSYIDGAITPDNWVFSPEVELRGTLEFWVADDGTYPENYSVYVSTDGENFTAIAENLSTQQGGAPNMWEKKTFDLSAYEGQTGKIAFRHHDCTDQDILLIDAVAINGDEIAAGEWITISPATSPQDIEGLEKSTEYEVQVQAVYADGTSDWSESVFFTTTDGKEMPTDLAVSEITHNSAVATWDGVQDKYNVRYRKAATADELFFENFEGEFPGNWTIVDGDGDGKNWLQFNPTNFTSGGFPAYEGSYGAMSRSWQSSALTPDNWLISPQIEDLGGMLRFYVVDDGANYPETYRIYVSTTDNDTTSFVPVTDDMLTPNSIEWTEVAIDLSAYEGQSGYIAFRHYNCTDKDFMIIDAVGIYKNEVPAGEWTVVENVEAMTYTMEGLEAETDYEVQVQGIYEDAKATTDWTPSVLFTTLEAPEETGYNEFYIVGTFNDWNYEEEDGGRIEMVANEEGTEFTGTVELEANAEFKLITPLEYGWKWFGGESDNGMYFLINSDMLDINITLIDGANFRVEDAGEYTITVKEAPNVPSKGIEEPLVMVVTKTSTGISTIGVDSNSNEWYNLNGQKLNGKPTVPGIYINGNRKVVIK
ncbi:MAG: choice-of-anchor J domain-containing protein [Muribaculaceae bacterium]|nr:choice-of-anchor J domain-containing protein [Muribaculaceae bacterium]